MKIQASVLLARQLSLALLIIVLAEHGHMQVDQSGVHSGSTGLARLERDLSRRGIAAPCTEIRAKMC
jgi:hypothetical protein